MKDKILSCNARFPYNRGDIPDLSKFRVATQAILDNIAVYYVTEDGQSL